MCIRDRKGSGDGKTSVLAVLDRILFHVYRQAELFGQPDGTCDMTVRLEDYVRSGRRGADRYLAVLDYSCLLYKS